MKVLVTGVSGQLGFDVMKVLSERNIDAIGADSAKFDITDFTATKKFIETCNPDAVVHCAAYTAVDKAEDNIERCRAVNRNGTENIAQICKLIEAKMIYISTDYVFAGTGENYYEVDDIINPINIYGQTKLAGELAVKAILDKYFTIRISWVFGKNGNNFVKTMLRLGKECNELNVVCDQIGSPTYTADLAVLLCDMVESDKYGTYHATNEGICSWAEFAEEIFRQANITTKINHIITDKYPTRAKRPLNSRLSKEKLSVAGFNRLPFWQDAVKRYLAELDSFS